ncbi:MAG TPA: glucuronate isomerase [Solirubrobacteraceae bacterium]
MTAAQLHPDRLLGIDPAVRHLARALYAQTAQAPIISPHGHVSPETLAGDRPFSDPAELFVTPDHYVTRLLHASGVPLDQLGLGDSSTPPREVWRTLCSNWFRFAGTPVRYWLEDALARVFGIVTDPSPETADTLYDELVELLAHPSYRPRALLERFGVAVLATTDDPADSLKHHELLAADPSVTTAVIPTLRADVYMTPRTPAWRPQLEKLSAVSGEDCGSYRGLLDAIRARRQAFAEHGATATDCGVADAWATPLGDHQAETLHRRGLDGTITPEEARAYRRNMLFQFGRMSAEDGLVMQLHAGVIRNHHAPTLDRFGPDTGHDLPAVTTYSEPLRELLNAVGTSPRFQTVLFTVDETAFSRDIAPLAGFYPSVYAGAPWWFLDAPAAVGRYRAAVTETAGFYKTSGFIDDTRALLSIPSRHDMSRRLDASYLARLVVNHQLTESDALRVAQALVTDIPRTAFRLENAP